jgi:hypothetical protein
VSRDFFYPLFFSSANNTPSSPDSQSEAVSNMDSNSRRYSITKIESNIIIYFLLDCCFNAVHKCLKIGELTQCQIDSALGLGRKFSLSFFRESFREILFSFSRKKRDENTKLSRKFSRKLNFRFRENL